MLKFETANDAFHSLYWRIVRDGVDFAGTKALFSCMVKYQLYGSVWLMMMAM